MNMAMPPWVATAPIQLVRKMGRLQLVPALAGAIVVAFVVVAVFADSIAPHSPTETSLRNQLRPPAWDPGGSTAFLLGTDKLGRDILSRVVHGARTSLLVTLQGLLLGTGIGTLVGLVSGYFRGWVDTVLMRFVDVMLALPIILFALIFVVALGPATSNVVIAIALVLWARFARVVRGEVLSVRESDYVALARVAGASHVRIIAWHVLPNVANTLMVLASLQVGWVIIVEATLSFLGAGVPPPTPAWGSMIAEGRLYVTTSWWLSAWAGLATMMVVLAFNLFGDWLRDTLDPKLSAL